MNDSQWDAKFKAFLKKTGDDFKKFGNEVKSEAQKLMTEVQDPARQEKLRQGLNEVGQWAKKTSMELATVVEQGVKKAEETLVKAGDKVNDFVARPMEQAVGAEDGVPPPAKTPPSPPPDMEEAKASAKKAGPAKKTVGKGTKKKTGASTAKKATRKTIGKKDDE